MSAPESSGRSTVQLAVADAVATITLDRPDRLNAFDVPMLRELRAVVDRVAEDDDVRAVIFTGAGRGFCAGLDLQGVDLTMPPKEFGAAIGRMMREDLNPLVEAIVGMGKPTISAVNGVAAGGGVGLALAADLVVAARSASFNVVFAPTLGIVPDTGTTWFLPRLVGRQRARGMAMLGEPLSATQAEEWGLIWRCVDDGAVLDEAMAMTAKLIAPQPAVWGFTKAALDSGTEVGLAEALSVEALANHSLTGTEAFNERVRAFRDRRR